VRLCQAGGDADWRLTYELQPEHFWHRDARRDPVPGTVAAFD
jgi:hypothetical protein